MLRKYSLSHWQLMPINIPLGLLLLQIVFINILFSPVLLSRDWKKAGSNEFERIERRAV
uniref:Uncharacterized protein n=1 Tax=Utricularia reniformis TaxID=192314 RepID=A0A1Y0B2X4_9LAMI|nr:hypothetical protein AEK19_MT1550 [Utricularia reniformis]ART31737.1 hypothetical protein AEK19_MT1550 [Utricularia reniformis]